MWEFYLASSEIAFRHLGLTVFHQMAHRHMEVPTRDYIRVGKIGENAKKKQGSLTQGSAETK